MTRLNKTSEIQEMAALSDWVALHQPKIPELRRLCHISNEGPRNRFKAAKMLLMPGVSDLFLAVPKNDYSGLWIELKAQGGKPTEDQLKWLSSSVEYGYMAALCYGWQEAVRVIEGYLAINGKEG